MKDHEKPNWKKYKSSLGTLMIFESGRYFWTKENLHLVRIGIELFLQCKCLRTSALHICYNLCIACKHCRVCPRVVQIQDHSLVDLQARDSCIHMSSISYRRSLHCNIPSWILAEYIFDLVRFLSLEMILVNEQFLHLTTSENWPEFLRTTSETHLKVLSRFLLHKYSTTEPNLVENSLFMKLII